LKDNQPTLYDGVRLFFAEPVGKLRGARQQDRHGNRHERREVVVSSELNAWAEWPYLGQVGQLTYTGVCRGKVSQETSYFITSLSEEEASPGRLLRLLRGHWGIENRVHWVRDVTLDEDRCQVRCGSGPQVMAALRNTAIGLLRLKGARNIAAAQRTLAWHAKRAIKLVTSRPRIMK
jgi:hypothetical protein